MPRANSRDKELRERAAAVIPNGMYGHESVRLLPEDYPQYFAKAEGARDMFLANAIPRYVWPGVDVRNTRAGMLCETLGFTREHVGINMAIDTGFRRGAPDGGVVERETGDGAIGFGEWGRRPYLHWGLL